MGINDIGTACQVQPGEVIYFDVFGYIVLACFDSLAAESSCVLCVAVLRTKRMAETNVVKFFILIYFKFFCLLDAIFFRKVAVLMAFYRKHWVTDFYSKFVP